MSAPMPPLPTPRDMCPGCACPVYVPGARAFPESARLWHPGCLLALPVPMGLAAYRKARREDEVI